MSVTEAGPVQSPYPSAAGTGAAAALDAERYLAARGTAETEPATAAVPA
ncbi:hypothetical protein ABZ038_12200 [Streptomyces sp. NPDC006349]